MGHLRKVTFTKDNQELIDIGKKTATSRRFKFKPGQAFVVKNHSYVITNIKQMTVEEVALNHYSEEGVNSPEEYRLEWTDITNKVRKRFARPDRPFELYVYDPTEKVWYHTFVRMRRLDRYGIE